MIYFYPKDMTSGCTLESQDFRDFSRPVRQGRGADRRDLARSVASHDKFAAKENLPFPLLADTDEKVCQLFDVIKQKSLYGRKYLGVERSTFLLDATGRAESGMAQGKSARTRGGSP